MVLLFLACLLSCVLNDVLTSLIDQHESIPKHILIYPLHTVSVTRPWTKTFKGRTTSQLKRIMAMQSSHLCRFTVSEDGGLAEGRNRLIC